MEITLVGSVFVEFGVNTGGVEGRTGQTGSYIVTSGKSRSLQWLLPDCRHRCRWRSIRKPISIKANAARVIMFFFQWLCLVWIWVECQLL